MRSGTARAIIYCYLLIFASIPILLTSNSLGQISSQTNPAQIQPMCTAVLPFEVPFFYLDANRLSLTVTDMVEEAFFNTGRYGLIDRRALLQVLREQRMGVTELADPRSAAQVGKIVGVQVLVTGSINAFELQYVDTVLGRSLYRAVARLTARAVDAETAEVVGIARAGGEARGFHPPAHGRKAIGEIALEQAVKELVGKLDATLQKGK